VYGAAPFVPPGCDARPFLAIVEALVKVFTRREGETAAPGCGKGRVYNHRRGGPTNGRRAIRVRVAIG
jgi:hypothetical protein